MVSPKLNRFTSPAHAAKVLQDGQVVAFPTETVYGLGADARSDKAVARIYEAKDRPSFNPLIIHVADVAMAETLADFTPAARGLTPLWPGPLSMVLPLRSDAGLSTLALAGQPSVAIRIPAHPMAQALLQAFGGPLAAPSANPSGRISPTTADHVEHLSGRIAGVLDGGPATVGLESTILDLRDRPRLLRAGGVALEDIETLVGPIDISTDAAPIAPGMLASHYAPQGAVRLNATSAGPGETLLGFGDIAGDLTLSATGDLTEAAANLFARLHELDTLGVAQIAVAPIPNHGLGRAINDRLRRAAAPRS